jgi:hypothetical protein
MQPLLGSYVQSHNLSAKRIDGYIKVVLDPNK